MATEKVHHEVGVRDFRASLRRWLDAVCDGEEVVITEHGLPIARVIGATANSQLERLISEGAVRRPLRPRTRDRRPRITPKASVSELIAEQRG